MNTLKEIKLSSNWTNVGIYVGGLLCVGFIPVLYFVITNQEFHIGIVVGLLGFLLLLGFVVYQLLYACDARIIHDKLVLKKQFRNAKSYPFDRIGYPSSFQIKRTKYVSVKMKKDDNSLEKYLIINTNSLLAFENKDAQQLLLRLRNLAMKQ